MRSRPLRSTSVRTQGFFLDKDRSSQVASCFESPRNSRSKKSSTLRDGTPTFARLLKGPTAFFIIHVPLHWSACYMLAVTSPGHKSLSIHKLLNLFILLRKTYQSASRCAGRRCLNCDESEMIIRTIIGKTILAVVVVYSHYRVSICSKSLERSF